MKIFFAIKEMQCSTLTNLGYSVKNGSYAHPERSVVFAGDYIDRGPKIKETLSIVRNMVESENAIALMGNHEYNALCFQFQESEGGHLRKHNIQNIIQHYETLKQFQNMQEAYEDYLDWFKTLPLFYETENFRAVHACWNEKNIQYLRSVLINDKLTDELIYQSVKKGTQLNLALEESLKGKEIKMPDGKFFTDKDGAKRTEMRIKWWEDPTKTSYRNISIESIEHLPDEPINTTLLKDTDYYTEDSKPVFFGHYWLKGNPSLHRNNICCLDYSVAKNGHLAAYKFNGESWLSNKQFLYV